MPTRINPFCAGLFYSALILSPSLAFGQTETVNTGLCGCQPGPGSPCPGNTNYLLNTFAYNITSGCPSFTAVTNFTTSGTYVAADIVNFKLYETNFSVFNTTTLVATITTGLGPGAHSFTGFNRTTCAAAQRYYWMTADFAAGAVAGHTIKIDLMTAGMYTITGALTYGTHTAAGLQTICNALPVELISFSGKNENGNNFLQWKTVSETNNDFFSVERSVDGIQFLPLAMVHGAGTSTQPRTYELTDEQHAAATTYYRLKQTDFNGQFQYLGIIAIEAGPVAGPVIRISTDFISVFQEEENLNYFIYDLSGRICISGILNNGMTTISFEELPPGIYILRLNDKDQAAKLFSKAEE